MMEGASDSAKERFIRAVILLVCSTLFSTIAYYAGLGRTANEAYIYFGILGIIIAAAIISRIAARAIMRRSTGAPRGPKA